MNKSSKIIGFLGSLIFALIVLSSCKHEEKYHSITDKIKAESKKYHGVSVTSEAYFGDMKMLEISEDGQSFLIPDRKGKLKLYACTECHSKPLQQMKSKDIKKAHWNISIKHADMNTMNCVTCHDQKNLDNLTSLTGVKIDFNKSYKLCSQCHTKQFKDWKGGAHGKQIGGWAPPRASMTCVNCHNPHNPSFTSKWPERYNSQKTKERK